MCIELRIAEQESQDAWDKIAEESRQGTIFHTWKWLRIIEKHTRSKLYPLIGLKESNIIGIYPIFYLENFFFKSVFSPPPWVSVPYLGLVIVNYDVLKQDKKESILMEFQKEVDNFIKRELKPNYIQIDLSPSLLDVRTFKWNGYDIEPIYNYFFDLSKGSDYIWQNFKRNLRQNINRAIKTGIKIEEGSEKEMEWILNNITRRYKEQGKFISINKEYIYDIYNAFYLNNLKIFTAKYNNKIIGGMVDIYYGNNVVSWLGSTKSNFDGLSPNELLEWEGIRYAGEYGMKNYIEMGANTERLCKYKSKYNPNLMINFSAKKHTMLSQLSKALYFKTLKPIRKYVQIFR